MLLSHFSPKSRLKPLVLEVLFLVSLRLFVILRLLFFVFITYKGIRRGGQKAHGP